LGHFVDSLTKGLIRLIKPREFIAHLTDHICSPSVLHISIEFCSSPFLSNLTGGSGFYFISLPESTNSFVSNCISESSNRLLTTPVLDQLTLSLIECFLWLPLEVLDFRDLQVHCLLVEVDGRLFESRII